jgi:hypothetical protein
MSASTPRIDKLEQPAYPQDDVISTRLGLKAYSNGIVYNGSAITVSGGSNAFSNRGVFIPYQMQDGSWRLKFNFDVGIVPSSTSLSVTISGITAKNSGLVQAVSVNPNSGSGTGGVTLTGFQVISN